MQQVENETKKKEKKKKELLITSSLKRWHGEKVEKIHFNGKE